MKGCIHGFFIQLAFECLLHAKHCASFWEYEDDQEMVPVAGSDVCTNLLLAGEMGWLGIARAVAGNLKSH